MTCTEWCFEERSVPENDVEQTIQEYQKVIEDLKTTTESPTLKVYFFWEHCLAAGAVPQCIIQGPQWDAAFLSSANIQLTPFTSGNQKWPICSAEVNRV